MRISSGLSSSAPGEDHFAFDLHVLDDVGDELERERSAFVGRLDADGFGLGSALSRRWARSPSRVRRLRHR